MAGEDVRQLERAVEELKTKVAALESVIRVSGGRVAIVDAKACSDRRRRNCSVLAIARDAVVSRWLELGFRALCPSEPPHSARSRPATLRACTVTAVTTPISRIPAKPISNANSRAEKCLGVKSP